MSADPGFETVMAYDAAFVPRYAQRFGERMLAALTLPARANVLDVACRTGYPAVTLLDLSPDGRVIAVDADNRYLEIARARAGSDLGKRIFFKHGNPTDLRFSDEVFTNVVGNLVDRVSANRGAIFSEARRVLRPGGQVAVTLPLRGSFIEVVDLLREVALRLDLARVTERVEQYVQSLPTAETFRAELETRGFEKVQVEAWEFTLPYANGSELFSDPVTQHAALAEWRWCAEGAGDPEPVLAEVRRAVDLYFEGRRFELTVQAGCATALRGRG